jgi:hypothetical protein
MQLSIDLFDIFNSQIERATVPMLAKITDHTGTREEIQTVQEALECAEDFTLAFLRKIGGNHALIYGPEGIPLAFVEA